MRIAHLADLHFGNKADKLEEVVITTSFALNWLTNYPPDLIVLAGDSVDEADGPIRIDSDAARAAISFVSACSQLAPVVIVRGTPSHDRRTPELFRALKGRYPIHVATEIEMVALAGARKEDLHFIPYSELPASLTFVNAILTFLPSPDKAHVVASFGGTSRQLTTLAANECLHDALAYIGEVNSQVPPGIPKILVGHGMITGARYSSGTIATGADLEFSVHDLNLTNTDVKLFGHIHAHQIFPGNIIYSGSPGRLNFGETEEKGFVMATINTAGNDGIEFIKTPAREFLFRDMEWDEEGAAKILDEAQQVTLLCQGKDVRFRYNIPEEMRHAVDRNSLQEQFITAGARVAKVEMTVIPVVRQRAAGISRKLTLTEKIQAWAQVTNTDIPARVMTIAATIEGETIDELLQSAGFEINA